MKKLSKVDTLKLKILEDICSGQLPSGSKIYSRHQFMRRFKCSRGSIDKAVQELINEGFLYSRQGSGTYVAEKTSPKGSLERIYIIGNYGKLDIASRFFQPGSLAAELQKYTECFLCDYAEVNLNLEKIARAGTAVIWDHPSVNHIMIMDYLKKMGIRQILIHRIFEDYEYITTDYEAGISEGLDWLVKNGGNEVIFFSTRTHTAYPYIAERQLVFFELAVRKGITIPKDGLYMDFDRSRTSFAEIEEVAGKLFKEKKCPKAIYVDYFDQAIPLLAVAGAHGLRPGKDFWLLVFDCEMSLYNRPGVAMIRQNTGAFRTSLVDWVTNYKSAPMRLKVKPELIVTG
jgi:hypothetical protein